MIAAQVIFTEHWLKSQMLKLERSSGMNTEIMKRFDQSEAAYFP